MTILRLASIVALAAVTTAAGAQQAARKPYIVQLADAPVATYNGGVGNLRATRPAAGGRLDVNASHVQAYAAYLGGRQTQVLAEVPQALVTYRYKNLLNGFAAFLTDAEFAKLVAHPAVQSITVDTPMPMNTATTPQFLGISGPGGAWSRLDAGGRAIKGEDVIIGHLDGGVWPENPSFSDKVDANGKPIASHLAGTLVYGPPPARWTGICQPSTGPSGVSFTAAHCNNKLIGARFYNATWKQAVALGIVTTWTGEYLDSPRDPEGHGTHTLATSGGNENVDVVVAGSPFTVSGIAPRARVVAYKVCYTSQNAAGVPQQGSCFQGDSAAAADQAVADGVDVINFSVGGSRTSVQGVVDTAFANATFAGVFVSASAGNSGPGASTVAHVNPWVITVGNSTHDRFTVATATQGNGGSFTGASFQTTGLTPRGLILATEAGVTPYASLGVADQIALARCYNSADRADATVNPAGLPTAASLLDPAKVAGKVVVCLRGGNVLVNKMSHIAAAGATGGIILNTPAGALPAPANGATATSILDLPFVVPTLHVAAASYPQIVSYAAGGAGTIAFSGGVQVPGVIAPVMNDGSSRGPNQRDANLLKPDITGPGTNIIAAYTNTSITPAQRLQIIAGTLVPGPGADMISGTSMSSPHVAGAAALMRQANPGWSPYAIKSALMTSAQPIVRLANGAADVSTFGQGAGHLNPNGALETKVVYDQTIGDHIDYYFGAIDGRTLNIASLTNGNLVGVGTFTRTLTNLGSSAVTLSGSGSIPGFTLTLSPSTLTIPPGGTGTYTATLQRTTATLNSYAFGSVTWAGSGQSIRSPLTIRPQLITVVGDVTDTRAVATKIYTAGFGYNGPLFTTGVGLVPAQVGTGTVATNATVCFPIGSLPAGVKMLRAQMFNSEVQGGAASDIDVEVRRNGTVVGSSLNADSNELVLLNNPAAGDYEACAVGFAPVGGNAAFKLSWWVLGPSNPGTLRAFGPRSVTTASVASIGLNWNVAEGARYLGLVEYRNVANSAAPIATTRVFIDTTAAVPATASATIVRHKEAPIY